MKIALLFYGRINKLKQQWNNIIESIGSYHSIDIFLSCDNGEQTHIDEFKNLCNPISFINDKIITDDDINILNKYEKTPCANVNNIICHFINKKRVFNLLKNYIENTNTNYDIILSLRTDLQINKKFNFIKTNDNVIFIPNDYDFGGINDQIAYGNINVMEKYMNIYSNMIYLLDNKLSIIHPETLTNANLKLNNINIFRFHLPYKIVK